jgi:hypothetical protein
MPPPMIAIEVRRAMFIPHACACWTRRRRYARPPGPSELGSGTNYRAAAFSGFLNGFEVANSIAQGSPFTFPTLRI